MNTGFVALVLQRQQCNYLQRQSLKEDQQARITHIRQESR